MGSCEFDGCDCVGLRDLTVVILDDELYCREDRYEVWNQRVRGI